MDKDVSQNVVNAKRNRGILTIAIIAITLVAAIWLVRSSIKSSINKSEMTTGIVEKGNVENTINASGEILPEFEGIITSPINASIQSVIMDIGSPVKAGQSILTLDKSAVQTEYEKSKF